MNPHRASIGLGVAMIVALAIGAATFTISALAGDPIPEFKSVRPTGDRIWVRTTAGVEFVQFPGQFQLSGESTWYGATFSVERSVWEELVREWAKEED